jgi:predicted ester cyclase
MENQKGVIRRYIKSYETGNLDNIKAFLHPLHVYYPPGGGKPMNLEERMSDEVFFFKAFSDIKTSVVDIIAEGDKVASRITMHCTHTGEYHGIKSTNKRIIISYMDIAHLKDDRILKEWAEFDMMSIYNQLQ